MSESKSTLVRQNSIGDAAIDGLFAGLIAGILMILVIILGGLLAGETPTTILARFSTGQSASPLAGGLLHLAVSGIYGVVYSLLPFGIPAIFRNRLLGVLAGLGYGLILLGLAVTVLLPGLRSPLEDLPIWVLALGHIVYGIVLGLRV